MKIATRSPMRRQIFFVAAFAIIALRSSAHEPQASPSGIFDGPGSKAGEIRERADGGPIYAGYYGEKIKFPYGWTAESQLQGKTEVVRFHRKWLSDSSFKPFRPKASDYMAQNIARMNLIELIVIPRNVPGGPGSLKALRRTREAELKQANTDYTLSDETTGDDWPRGTFHVSQTAGLYQTYAASPEEFFILTSGFHDQKERDLDHEYADSLIGRSLSNHLLTVHKKTIGEILFSFLKDRPSGFSTDFKIYLRTKDTLDERRAIQFLSAYQRGDNAQLLQMESGNYPDESLVFQKIFAGLNATLIVLAFWPGNSARPQRVRLLGRSSLAFMWLTGLAGFLVVYLPARLANAQWKSDELAAAIPVFFIPWMSWIAARRLGSAHAKRIFLSTGVLAMIWSILMLWGSDFNNLTLASTTAYGNTTLLLFVGLTFGITFGLAFGARAKKTVL